MPLIAGMSAGQQSRTMFSRMSWACNVGIGLGSAAGGLVASVWSTAGLYALVLVYAASYLVAAYILARHVVVPPHTPPGCRAMPCS